ncbi:MAG TPA: trehalase family glycosidase [Edaphobacter sp.]|nr:trehalase family glycosidase [Edaphobacter sp.]
MKQTIRRYIALLVSIGFFTINTNAQPKDHNHDANAKILAYIANGWNSLSRSMSECKSLVDPKVTTAPVLYLPYGMATPPAVASAHRQCDLEVRNLPRKIAHLGDIRVNEIPMEGLLYLPNRYVVPGGRFNEMYGWDSYFIILGLIEERNKTEAELAKGMVENFFYEIENYGAILNANRTYFFTRSQPPFLTSMIREVYEHPAGQRPTKAWLAKAYGYAQRDYELWTSPIHRAGDTGLTRYYDIGEGPVPEMADDSDYYADVIRWLLAHPDIHTGYLIEAPDDPSAAQAISLAKLSCDISASKICARAHVEGHRLTADFYRNDRAMRESGFDISFRFGPFSGSTGDFAPVCLNSLLYKYERDMAHFATLLLRPAEAAEWNRRAAARRDAINKYLWNPTQEMFDDYDFVKQRQSAYKYLTTFYPLWAGLATKRQAAALRNHLSDFEHDGGLAMSDTNSGTQWDLPFGWAPTNWLAIKGLLQYGFTRDVSRIARKFSQTILQNFLNDATIREKYNVVSGSANVAVATGYKSNVVGFGWTNGVYLQMHQLLTARSKGKISTSKQDR